MERLDRRALPIEAGGGTVRLIIHVRLNDPDHDSQMKDLGILGVNILHAVFSKGTGWRNSLNPWWTIWIPAWWR